MPPSITERSEHEQQLDALIAEYELAAERGVPLDTQGFVQQYPEFAAELRQYLADAGQLQGWIGPQPATPAVTMTSGLRIRDYQVLEKIGAGGMGTVYQARHLRLDKTVALKIMKADRDRNSHAIARFEREMWAVGKLEHPHIVRALDAGDEAGTHFLVMEYLDGCDLGRLLKAKGRLELPLACELIRQAALGLQHAHDHNLVHRDVKPSNLLLSASGQVKVLDLGLAQLQARIDESSEPQPVGSTTLAEARELTREGQFVGTWRYMAPEQFLPGRQVDSRADIFSLGVTFYCLLVGELPLGPGQTAVYLPPITTLRPDVPPDVQVLLGEMLAYHPEERVQTMAEVASVLQTYALQGAVNIQAIGGSLELAKQGSSNPLDATQSWSSTADDVEIIPPPIVPRPPAPRPVKRTAGAKPSEPPAFNRVLLVTSACAILAVATLPLAMFSKTVGERSQVAVRIAELKGITARALDRRDLGLAQLSLPELITLSNQFPNLGDAEAIAGFQETIRQQEAAIRDQERVTRLQESATERLREVQTALDNKDWPVLADRLRAYRQEPYKTDVDKWESLLTDVEFLLSPQPRSQDLVKDWTIAELDEFLRTRELPHSIKIADETVREVYRNQLLVLADVERKGHETEAKRKDREKAAAIAAQREIEEAQRREADRKRAAEIQAEERRLNEEASEEWRINPQRHGVLTLIPQDATGAVGVASIHQMLMSCREIDRVIRERYASIGFFAWLFGFETPEVYSLEKELRKVLETAPLGCYQQDQPVAIVFANPQAAGFERPTEDLNALIAMWFRPQIEKLGVVVGKPRDLGTVEWKLKLPEDSLAGGTIQTSRLSHFDKRMPVFSLVQDGRLFVGLNRRAVQAVADGLRQKGSLAQDEDLPKREAARLASMDLLVHFGPGAWKKEWDNIAKDMRAGLAAVNDEPETKKLAQDLDDITRLAKSFLLGIRLDGGVQASLLVTLSRNDADCLNRFQQLFNQGHAPLTLEGLPQQGAIGAFATRGNGLSSAAIAQSLLLLSQQSYLFPEVHFPADKEQRDLISKAFQEVWNQVEGTRAGNYHGARSTIVVLDTHDEHLFIKRLQELVQAWDDVSLQLAGGNERQARYRFAIPAEKFDDRPAYRLSLKVRGQGGETEHKMWIVPLGRQMVLSYGDDDNASLREVVKDRPLGEPARGLAEHPAILASEPKLPRARKMELYLRLSEIRRLAQGNPHVGGGNVDYSSASLTLGENSILLDAWVPLSEILRNRDLIEFDKAILPPK